MKSYLKFLSRNKLYTAIEFVGLAVSLAFVIIIGSYVWQQFAVTRENPFRENIYLPGLPGCPGLTYAFPDVITEIPEIETVSRFCEVAPTYGKNEVLWGAAVDRQFFDLLPNYRFVEGSADALSSLSNIIVSESFARKMNLALGDRLELSDKEYTVGAIFEDSGGTVMKVIEAFLPVENYNDAWEPFDNFGSTICFIKTRPGADRQVLYDRISARVDRMLEAGLVEETRAFYENPSSATAVAAIGYKELLPWLEGREPLEDGICRVKQETCRYAKRQGTWFRRNSQTEWIMRDEICSESRIFEMTEKMFQKNLAKRGAV